MPHRKAKATTKIVVVNIYMYIFFCINDYSISIISMTIINHPSQNLPVHRNHRLHPMCRRKRTHIYSSICRK